MEKKHTCCICGIDFDGWGDNPEPFGADDDKCCHECNDRFVVPVRLILGRNVADKGLLEFLCRLAGLGRDMVEMRRKISAQRKPHLV